MPNSRLVIAGFVLGTLAFAAGWTLHPAQWKGVPEIGLLDATHGVCDEAGMAFIATPFARRSPLDYSPANNAINETLIIRRTGNQAVWRLLSGEKDDEVQAEGHEYQLTWKEEGGWRITDCHAARNFYPGRS
jgi:hypothetical protein